MGLAFSLIVFLHADLHKPVLSGPSVEQAKHQGEVHSAPVGQFGKIFVEGGKKMGRTMTVLEDGIQRKALEEAGFEAIEEANFKVRSTTE